MTGASTRPILAREAVAREEAALASSDDVEFGSCELEALDVDSRSLIDFAKVI